MAVETELRLSAQRAFLGRIHPEMRLVKVKTIDREIVVHVVVSRAPSDQIREDVSVAAAEIIADFPRANKITEQFEVSVAPLAHEDVLAEGWIYQRAE